MVHVEVYKVSFGFRIDDETCDRILAQSLSSTSYVDPIYILRIQKTETSTIIWVSAISKASARRFKEAVMEDLGSIEAYEPQISPTADPSPDPLDVWARVGQWTKTIGNATTTVSSLPSDPKGIIVWGSGFSGTVLEQFQDGGGVVFGFSNGTENRDMAYAAQHNQTASNSNRSISKKAFHLVDPAGDASGHIKENCTISFSTNQFSMNWSGTTLACVGNYYVFGGDDISSVLIQDLEVGTDTSGIVNYNIGDRYDFGLMLYPFKEGLPWPTTPTGITGGLQAISCQAGPHISRSWSSSIRNRDGADPSDTCSLQRVGYVLSGFSDTVDLHEEQYGRFIQWTDTGFDLEWFKAPGATDFIFTGLFVKGGNWDAGYFYQSLEPTQVYTLNMSKYPTNQGIMAFSINKGDLSDEGHGDHSAYLSIGGADNQGNQGTLVYGGVNMASPTVETTQVSSQKFMKYIGAPDVAAGSHH